MLRSLTDKLMYSATRITANASGIALGTGTGFFYRLEISGLDNPVSVLVTNKHVIRGADQISFIAHVGNLDKTPTGEVMNCDLSLDNPNVVDHPSDDVDLCAIFIGGLIDAAAKQGKHFFFVGLTEGLIPADDEWQNFDALEELLMVGCPRGIYDEVNCIPILRRGHSATPLSRDYNGSPSFLVDMACYPGSSGSPVFVFNSGFYHDAIHNETVAGGRIKFVGVLFQGPLINSQGHIVFQEVPRVEMQTMMHLGEVIKTTELKVLSSAAIKAYHRIVADAP